MPVQDKIGVSRDVEKLDDPILEKLTMGLFNYPLLQAADILVHRATHVPVGSDQTQHLEFARHCARSFNHSYGEILVRPQMILCQLSRPTCCKRLRCADCNSTRKARQVTHTASAQDVQVA